MDKPSCKALSEYQDRITTPNGTESCFRLLPLAAHQTCRVIPYHRNLNAVYRSHVATRLNTLALQAPGNGRDVALWGVSGVGKTQIALDFAYQRCKDPMCSVFWVSAGGRTAFLRDFKKISTRLGLHADLEDENLLKAVGESTESKPQWLLVLDGADDLAALGVGARSNSNSTQSIKNILNYVPSSYTGSILWTSCDEGILDIVGCPKRAILVDQMTLNEALRLFEIARNQVISETEITSTRTLIDKLGRLPLAILQAGIYLRQTATAVEQYLSELAKASMIADAHTQSKSCIPRGIIKASYISIRYIEENSRIACNVLYVLAHLSNKEISLNMIRAATSACMAQRGRPSNTVEQEMEAALILLQEYSFLRIDSDESSDFNFDMPKTIQEVARVASASRDRTSKMGVAMRSDSTVQTVQIGAGRYDDSSHGLTGANPDVSFFFIALRIMECLLHKAAQEIDNQCEKYLSHSLRLCKLTENREEKEIAAMLLTHLSGYFCRKRSWQDMEVAAKKALELRMEALGEKHVDTLWSMGNLASSFYQQARYEEAEETFDHLLRLRRAVLGPEHPHTIWTISSLAATYGMQGRYDEAEKIFLSLINSQRDTLGEGHPDTIVSICNLAATYHSQGRYDEAENLLTSVLALSTKESQHDHPDIFQVRDKLSMIRRSRALVAKAE